MSLFSSPGMYLRDPRSGVEAISFPDLKAKGFRALALNTRDHLWSDWQTVITRATAAGIVTLPWARTMTNAEIVALCKLAHSLPAKAVIVNAENELIDGVVDTSVIAKECVGLDACVSTLAWVGTPAVNLSPLRELELHLQLFPQENETSKKARDCLAHAYENSGAKYVSFMHGVHGLTPASFPPLRAPYWLYTLDDCQSSWQSWTPTIAPPLNLPYTGPLYGPSSPRHTKRETGTARGLKIILHEAGFGTFPDVPDGFYNSRLENAMRRMQLRFGVAPATGAYGKASYQRVRRLLGADAGSGYACGLKAQVLIKSDVP